MFETSIQFVIQPSCFVDDCAISKHCQSNVVRRILKVIVFSVVIFAPSFIKCYCRIKKVNDFPKPSLKLWWLLGRFELHQGLEDIHQWSISAIARSRHTWALHIGEQPKYKTQKRYVDVVKFIPGIELVSYRGVNTVVLEVHKAREKLLCSWLENVGK